MTVQETTRVTKHTKGLLISNPQNRQGPPLSAVQLRVALGAPVTMLHGEGFLVPEAFAGTVLEQFGTEDVDWHPEILTIARRQLEEQQLQLRAKVEVAQALESPSVIPSCYPVARKLDPHQVEAVAAVIAPSLRGIGLFDEQGTGKTAMTLAAYDILRTQERITRLLVIAPKSVMGGWKSDAKMLFGDDYVVSLVSGNVRQRRKTLLRPHDILVMSYGTATRDIRLLRALLSSHRNQYMLAVDESFYVKNPQAQRTQAVVELRQYCERAIILCGTPAPNSPRDIVQQLDIADQGVAFGTRPIPKDDELAHEVISRYLEDAIYLRRLKQDVLPNIPDKEIDRLVFPLQPHQQVIYDKARDELILEVRGVDDTHFAQNLASFLARRSALMRICSHPAGIDPLYDETPSKHLVLDKLIRQIVEEQEEKIVIWSFFRYSLDAIAQRYAPYGLARIDGSVTSTDDRIEAIRCFQQDPEVRIFLGNAAAAGAGITLTAARHAVYESFSNQAAHYMQSVDRIHRRGQEDNVHIHVLLAQDTIEETEFDRILDKERAGRNLLGDVYDEPLTRERFLASLGAKLE